MKKLIMAFAVCLSITSCTTLEQNASKGAIAGGTIGGVIGHQSGQVAEGVAIGAAAGSLLGYIFTPKQTQSVQPCPNQETTTISRRKTVIVNEQVPVHREVTTKKYYVDPQTGRKVYIY
jgi:uncharacterized protein YcfJ